MCEFTAILENMPVSSPANVSPLGLYSFEDGVDLDDDLCSVFIDDEPESLEFLAEFEKKHPPPWASSPLNEKKSGLCFCDRLCSSEPCKKMYGRFPRHARVLEQSSQLVRYVDGEKYKNVQFILPPEIQKHIGHGSCTHIFDSLKLFVKYLQLELGWCPQTGRGYKCSLPSVRQYNRARDIMLGIGLRANFYVYRWIPTFHARFVHACGGLRLLQMVATRFFNDPQLRLFYDPTDASEILVPTEPSEKIQVVV